MSPDVVEFVAGDGWCMCFVISISGADTVQYNTMHTAAIDFNSKHLISSVLCSKINRREDTLATPWKIEVEPKHGDL